MRTVHHIKRVFVAIIGGTVVLIGIALIVLPGPAFIVIPAGLAILATEFVWARVWIEKIRAMVERKRRSPTPKSTPIPPRRS